MAAASHLVTDIEKAGKYRTVGSLHCPFKKESKITVTVAFLKSSLTPFSFMALKEHLASSNAWRIKQKSVLLIMNNVYILHLCTVSSLC